MAGTNPIATWLRSVFTTQTPSAYKAAIDGNFAVAERMVGSFAPQQQTSPNMTIALRAGNLFDGTTLTEVATQNTGTITAPVSNPRIDRVVIDVVTGVVSVIAGTEAGSPVAPVITAGKIPVAQILLQTTSTTITNSMITDERALAAGYARTATNQSGGTVSATTISASGLITATGGQIKFPAAQVPSADVNTLDDYEEGTWTPSLGGTATYSIQLGNYTKIGNIVYVSFDITISAIGTGSTSNISGLPFAASSSGVSYHSFNVCHTLSLATAVVEVVGYFFNNSSSISFVSRTVAATSSSTNPIFGTGTSLRGSGFYRV